MLTRAWEAQNFGSPLDALVRSSTVLQEVQEQQVVGAIV
jgi:hypothetical protein